MSEMIHMYFLLAKTQKYYEIRVNHDANFREIIHTLNQMMIEENSFTLINENVFIFDRENRCYCDLDISLHNLGVDDDMTFVVI